MDLFKGYIRTNGKVAVEPFKDVDAEDLRTIGDVSSCKSYAGVLADDTVLIGVDNFDESEKFMNIVEKFSLSIFRCFLFFDFLFRTSCFGVPATFF